MSERTKNLIAIGVSGVALAMILFGLSSEPASTPSAEDRIASLSSSIRCPFCNGESLADSQAGVAADYRDVIAERVAAGATDEEILEEFADNFGDSFILDTSTSPWSVALWIVPVLALVAGGGVLVWMRRNSSEVGQRDVASPSEIQGDAHLSVSSSKEEESQSSSGMGGSSRVSGRTLVGAAIVGLAVIAIGAFAVNSLSDTSVSGAEGVAGDVVSGQEQVDLSTISNEEMEQVVTENPDIIPMRLALARRYFEASDFDKALDHYMIVLDQEKHPEALANVGWMTYVSGRPDVALGYVEAALQRQPGSLVATWYLGQIQYTLGNDAAASEALTAIIDSDDVPADVKESARTLLLQVEGG